MFTEKNSSTEENVNCRAKAIGGTGLVDCLCEGTICQYAMPFGYSHLCNHPEKHTIADSSKADSNKTESGQ
ncbi:MAG: hypothetical protein LCH54_02410 [Bacteroidetes bacterium]|nr:hypothetical protein [Bacteroidota bacterium]